MNARYTTRPTIGVLIIAALGAAFFGPDDAPPPDDPIPATAAGPRPAPAAPNEPAAAPDSAKGGNVVEVVRARLDSRMRAIDAVDIAP